MFWHKLYFFALHFTFIRTNKILERLSVVILSRFLISNVLILFLFSMKHSYLLKAKITFDVNTGFTLSQESQAIQEICVQGKSGKLEIFRKKSGKKIFVHAMF